MAACTRCSASLTASLLKSMVPSSVVGMSAGGHRVRVVRCSVHVVISCRLNVVAEDSRRRPPHPFSGALTPTFGTQPRDECLYFGVLGLQLRGVVGVVALTHLVLLGRLLALLLLRADALLLPALVLRLLHAT